MQSSEVDIAEYNDDRIEQYIKEYIELIKKYESLYEQEQLFNRKDSETTH